MCWIICNSILAPNIYVLVDFYLFLTVRVHFGSHGLQRESCFPPERYAFTQPILHRRRIENNIFCSAFWSMASAYRYQTHTQLFNVVWSPGKAHPSKCESAMRHRDEAIMNDQTYHLLPALLPSWLHYWFPLTVHSSQISLVICDPSTLRTTIQPITCLCQVSDFTNYSILTTSWWNLMWTKQRTLNASKRNFHQKYDMKQLWPKG